MIGQNIMDLNLNRLVKLFLVISCVLAVSCAIPFSRTEEFEKDIPAINIGPSAPEISIEVNMPDIIFQYNIELESAELFYIATNNTEYDCNAKLTLNNIKSANSEVSAKEEVIELTIPKNSKTKEKSINSEVITRAVNNKDKSITISFKNSMGNFSAPSINDKSISFSGRLKIKGKFSLK